MKFIVTFGVVVAVMGAAAFLAGRDSSSSSSSYRSLVQPSMQIISPDGPTGDEAPTSTLAAFDLGMNDPAVARDRARTYTKAAELLRSRMPSAEFAAHHRGLVREFDLGAAYHAALARALEDGSSCGSASWTAAQAGYDAYVAHALQVGMHYAKQTGGVWSVPTFEKPRQVCG